MKPACAAVLALFLGSIVWAQDSREPRILIPLLVQDSHRRPITGLTAASLTFSENKTPVAQVSLLNAADLPLQLGLVVDTSNSERDADLNDILVAAKNFVIEAVRRPQDQVFFLTFDAGSEATNWLKREQLTDLSLKVRVGGATALYDAVAIACQKRMGPRDWNQPTRRVLIVISDGDDNQSRVGRDVATAEALKSGVVMFTLSTFALRTAVPGTASRGNRIMENWAAVTGGQFFAGLTRRDAPKVFAKVLELMDAMYYARYVPPSSTKTIHEIDVKSSRKGKVEISYPRKYLWLPSTPEH